MPASTYDPSRKAAKAAATIRTRISVDLICSKIIAQRDRLLDCGKLLGPNCLSLSTA